MEIRIAPFSHIIPALPKKTIPDGYEVAGDHVVVYWGIFLDGKQISYTSSEELAAKTKVWLEKWLTKHDGPPLL